MSPVDDSMNLTYNIRIHSEDEGGLWAEVDELPGLFVSGRDEEELFEALQEAIGMYLSTPRSRIEVRRAASRPVVEQVVEYARIEVPC